MLQLGDDDWLLSILGVQIFFHLPKKQTTGAIYWKHPRKPEGYQKPVALLTWHEQEKLHSHINPSNSGVGEEFHSTWLLRLLYHWSMICLGFDPCGIPWGVILNLKNRWLGILKMTNFQQIWAIFCRQISKTIIGEDLPAKLPWDFPIQIGFSNLKALCLYQAVCRQGSSGAVLGDARKDSLVFCRALQSTIPRDGSFNGFLTYRDILCLENPTSRKTKIALWSFI